MKRFITKLFNHLNKVYTPLFVLKRMA